MTIIKDEYLDLAPHGRSLSDVVVLAQAWKKSDEFIRRHNWYADMLELDSSTVDLENSLNRWAGDVSKGSFQPEDLLLVPAPKNAKWEFLPAKNVTSWEDFLDLEIDEMGSDPQFGDWVPRKRKKGKGGDATNSNASSQKLRPLFQRMITLLCKTDHYA